MLQVHPTSVTNTIDGLQRLDLVKRTQHARDRRKWLASITPQGGSAAEGATEVLNSEKFGTESLRRQDLEELFRLLHRLRAGAHDFVEGD